MLTVINTVINSVTNTFINRAWFLREKSVKNEVKTWFLREKPVKKLVRRLHGAQREKANL
jgi:hypothetical protein